jgi:hypothetical protein
VTRVLVVVLVAGCGNDPPMLDPAADGPPLARCTLWTYEPHEFVPCDVPEDTQDLVLAGLEQSFTLDGDTGDLFFGPSELIATLPRASRDGRSIVSVRRFEVALDSSLSVIGTQPVVIAAWEDIAIHGSIVTSPTVTSSACVPPTPGTGCSGGGGGGFAGIGGTGGDSLTDPGGAGGGSIPLPAHLSAGCSGAVSSDAIEAGLGGGAVALVARTSLLLDGAIVAEGARSPSRQGGSGSGGMVELEALDLTIADGTLQACGGVVSGGACLVDGEPGDDANAFGEMCGEGGGGASGYLVYRAHGTASIDPFESRPPLQPF